MFRYDFPGVSPIPEVPCKVVGIPDHQLHSQKEQNKIINMGYLDSVPHQCNLTKSIRKLNTKHQVGRDCTASHFMFYLLPFASVVKPSHTMQLMVIEAAFMTNVIRYKSM